MMRQIDQQVISLRYATKATYLAQLGCWVDIRLALPVFVRAKPGRPAKVVRMGIPPKAA